MPISYDIQGCCPGYYCLTNHPQSSLGKNHCIMGQQSDTHNMSRPLHGCGPTWKGLKAVGDCRELESSGSLSVIWLAADYDCQPGPQSGDCRLERLQLASLDGLCGLLGLPNTMALGSTSRHPKTARCVPQLLSRLGNPRVLLNCILFVQAVTEICSGSRGRNRSPPSSSPQWEEWEASRGHVERACGIGEMVEAVFCKIESVTHMKWSPRSPHI